MIDGQAQLDNRSDGQIYPAAHRVGKGAAGDPIVVVGVFTAEQAMEICLDSMGANGDSRAGQVSCCAWNQ